MAYGLDKDYSIQRGKDTLKIEFDRDKISSRNLTGVGKKLASLDLKSYIRPKNLKTDELNVLESYEIDNYGKSKTTKFTKLGKEELVESLRSIRDDIITLSNNELMITNLELKNIKILKNRIYLVGITNIEHNMDKEYAKLSSNVLMNEFFGSNGITKEMKDVDVFKVYKGVFAKFLESDYEYIEDYYDKVLDSKESIKSYIKRL